MADFDNNVGSTIGGKEFGAGSVTAAVSSSSYQVGSGPAISAQYNSAAVGRPAMDAPTNDYSPGGILRARGVGVQQDNSISGILQRRGINNPGMNR